MKKILLRDLLSVIFFLNAPLLWAQTEDIYEDASAYGYDLKQQAEDEIFFYESRFVDMGVNLGGRSFAGSLRFLFGPGFSFGGFFPYFFSRSTALEMTVNSSWHEF